ncbi:MAG: hypothetical protein JSW58_03110 [Candidatus Latescibacterota bacterium]|nr:MAG: hypothetical protein JSW58_03110 [Candidatus Latescibacterota bacterium]
MGKKYSSQGKKYLFATFPQSFHYDANASQSARTIAKAVGGGKRCYLYMDFSIKFIEMLSMSRYQKLTGSLIVYSMMNYVESYTQRIGFDTVVLAIDGDYDRRPELKVRRDGDAGKRMSPDEVVISDKECNLTCDAWMGSRSDNEVREKVIGYVARKFCQQWARKQGAFGAKPALIVDAVPFRDERGSIAFDALEVRSGHVRRSEPMRAYEGEQIAYGYMKRFTDGFPHSVHVIDGFTDTDHFSYCCLLQNLVPESRIFLRMKRFPPKGEERPKRSYVLDVRSMCLAIRKRWCGDNDLAVPKFVLCWGILTGNDFTCVRSGNAMKTIRSVVKGFELSDLISLGANSKWLEVDRSRSPGTSYKLNLDPISEDLRKVSGVRVKGHRMDLLKSIVSRSQWCINYFSNPSDEAFAGTIAMVGGKRTREDHDEGPNRKRVKLSTRHH